MRPSIHRSSIVATFALLSFAVGESLAQPRSTVPIGCLTYPVVNGATTSFGVPLLDVSMLTGYAAGVTSNTLTVANVNWSPNQFVNGAVPCFVAIRTGSQAGRTLLVTGNSSNTLTLDVEDTPLDASGFSVNAGADTIDLFQGETLGRLFGSSADANGFLASGIKAGTTNKNADNVQLFNGTAFVTYFFSTTVGSWVLNGSTTNQNGLILYPDDGMLVLRKGPTGNLTMAGRVPSTRLLTKLPGGATSVVGIRFPTATTLGGLNFGAPGTWITGSSSTADTVSLWTGSKWDGYYKNASNQWVKLTGSGADQSATVIPAGTAIRITKKGTATGAAAYFSQPLPYGL